MDLKKPSEKQDEGQQDKKPASNNKTWEAMLAEMKKRQIIRLRLDIAENVQKK